MSRDQLRKQPLQPVFGPNPEAGNLVTAVGERAARTVGALDRPYPARELAAGIFRLIVFCG